VGVEAALLVEGWGCGLLLLLLLLLLEGWRCGLLLLAACCWGRGRCGCGWGVASCLWKPGGRHEWWEVERGRAFQTCSL